MALANSLLYFSTTGSSSSDINGGGGLHSIGSVTVGKAPTAAQMLSYMDANGGPVDSFIGGVYEANTPGPGIDRITKVGEFTNTVDGHVVYIQSTLEGADAWIVVILRTDDRIEFSSVFWTDGRADVVVNVGGAFDTVQVMVSNADDADSADQLVHMFYNVVQDIAAATFDLDNVITGTKAINAWVILESYTNTPGDSGRTKWTGDASAHKGSVIDDIENFIWRHGWLEEPDKITNDGFYVGATSAQNVIFEDCFADGWADGFWSDATTKSVLFIGCDATNAGVGGFYLWGLGDVAYKCRAWNNGQNFNTRSTTGRHVLIDCLEYDASGTGIKGRDAGNFTVAINCTSDNAGEVGVLQDLGASTIILINSTVSNATYENIAADPNDGSIYAIYTNTYNPGVIDVFLAGPGMLAVNPQFDSDYLPATWQLMEAGIEDTGGSPTHIGAVGKPAAYDIIVAEES